jgi:hypothetical protein
MQVWTDNFDFRVKNLPYFAASVTYTDFLTMSRSRKDRHLIWIPEIQKSCSRRHCMINTVKVLEFAIHSDFD